MDHRNTRGGRVAGLPKLCGADVELGNFILGSRHGQQTTDEEASRALLREIAGVPAVARPPVTTPVGAAWGSISPVAAAENPQDLERRFLATNGGCAYIDLNHLELCLPEVRSARQHVAYWHAMLRIARAALEAANEGRPPGERIQLLANNSDGQGHSYGGHQNFLVTREVWDRIFHRKPHHLAWLAAYQASSVVFTGQGKVGSENGAPEAAFQLSQRADFLETVAGPQTTFRRPIVNSRDESLCGRGADGAGLARLHVICFDSTLCHVASFLKVGVMQVVLALLEAGDVDPGLALEDPVAALRRFSHDPGLGVRAETVGGERLTAVELQLRILEQVRSFAEGGGLEGIVPEAAEILALWEDTLVKLQAGDLAALAPRLDWALKLTILRRARARRSDLDWGSPELKHLDHVYASLDAAEGLYWAFEGEGLVERVVSEGEIQHAVLEPPEDTRAWTRTMLLRAAGGLVEQVDWHRLGFWNGGGRRWLELGDPLAFTRAETEGAFRGTRSPGQLLDALGASPPVVAGTVPLWSGSVGGPWVQ